MLPPPIDPSPKSTQQHIRAHSAQRRARAHLTHSVTSMFIPPITQSRKPSREPKNKKPVLAATFLRLAIVASSPIANRGTKTQQKWHISSLKEPRRAPNRKKVAKIPSFLFFAMGPIAATGQITRKRAEHHDQQPEIRNKKGARHADASEKPIWLESTLPWHHTARNKHRVQPSTYRRSPLRPAPRGCTEAR